MPRKFLIYGFNPFNVDGDGSLQDLDFSKFLHSDQDEYLIEITATHALLASGSTLLSYSSITDSSHTIDCGSRIVNLSANNWHCLILLENFRELFKYDIYTKQVSKLDFLTVESTLQSEESKTITHLACGDKVSVAVTGPDKSVFNIPNRTFTFPKHVRIAKVAVGLEHCLLLTGNGDVYSWGCGLRGQLGNGEITCHQEQPQLVEALAGVKIVDIAAGGWHSAAVSSFGDLYCWGWNSKGQLGITDEKHTKGTVFTLPQVIDAMTDDGEEQEETIFERVHCGHTHTVAVSSSEELYFAGSDLRQKLNFMNVERKAKLCGFQKFKSASEVRAKLLKSGPNSLLFVGESVRSKFGGEMLSY